jgi:hypothetical protein
MRGLVYGIGAALTALAFLALGADAYWSWKAHAWTFEPIGGWLDRIDPRWTTGLRGWAAERSAHSLRMAERLLGWPVWPPAFIAGGLLGLVTRRR